MSYVEKYEKLIKRQLQNGNDIEEYIEKVYCIILDNIMNLYHDSDMSLREFALFVDSSHSTVKRLLEQHAKVEFSTICKIAACCDYPLECMVSNLSNEDIKFLSKYNELPDEEKNEIDKYLEKLIKKHNKIKDKLIQDSQKGDKHITMQGQLSLFDLMETDTETNKGD